MPTPVPTPTAEEIVTVAEIMMVSVEAATTAISADDDQGISDAKWSRTLDDIDNWPAVRDEAGDIKKVGEIEFFEGTGETSRLGFRNTVRTRYGYAPLASEVISGAVSVVSASVAVPVISDW